MSFLKKIIPANIYEKARQILLFDASDPNNLWQLPPRFKTMTHTKVDRIKGYRYPAPGSQPQPSIPSRSSKDAIYDTKYLDRDPRNLPKQEFYAFNSTKQVTQLLENNYIHKIGSPGQKIPAVAAYDPSGLRTTMTANWPALQKAVMEKAAPDHLPAPAWHSEQEDIIKECERKGLPIMPGRRYKFKEVSANYNQVRW